MSQTQSPIDASTAIQLAIDGYKDQLRDINREIHQNPELGFEEFKAHDNITNLLTSLGYTANAHSDNLPTSFTFEYGYGGRVVAFNAEYDALPGIGHACGHNLIATAAIAAFLGLASAIKAFKLPGRVRLIGTPAEEGGGGKLKLLEAGAYDDVDACLMVHPLPGDAETGAGGQAYWMSLANHKFGVIYTGRTAHAAMAPWEGVNALDAVVLAYNGISVLRQQIKPYERIHGIISDGGKRPNVIPEGGRLEYYIRSRTLKEATELKERALRCFEGAAMATGCSVEYEMLNTYADLRPNRTMCELYAAAMAAMDSPVGCDPTAEPLSGSTDMGNVSYECPSFHGMFGIRCPPGASNHTLGFTAAAGTERAFEQAVVAAKGMAVVGWNILADDSVAAAMKRDYEKDKEICTFKLTGS